MGWVRRTALATLCAALLAGCGNDPTPVPDVATPRAPEGERTVRLKAAGVRFEAPVNWSDLPARGRRAGGIQSNRATLAVWRYERSEPLPESRAQLERVQELLVERVRQRDPGFELEETSYDRRGGARTIELVGRQTIAGLPFGVRSAHLFSDGEELVVDAYAPPEHFERVDRTVFRPLLRSLKLDG